MVAADEMVVPFPILEHARIVPHAKEVAEPFQATAGKAYTIEVTHNGIVDLTIGPASGDRTEQ